MPEEMHTLHQLAERWDIHRNTVMLMIEDGRLSAQKIQGRWLVPHSELDNITIIRDGFGKPIIYRSGDPIK